MQTLTTTCLVAGGGPAGVMVGYLLARAGIETLVLEKHKDFLRDFRGDTVHPSTLDVIAELGLLEEFLRLPHQEVRQLRGQIGDALLTIGDFSHVGTRCKFVALMPQWHFLNFLAEHGRRVPGFKLRMCTEVTELIKGNGRVTGVRTQSADGPLAVTADLVIAADGRHSAVRARAGLEVQDLGSPIDVSEDSVSPPWQARLFDRIPALQRIPARVVGVGVRPEHVRIALSAYAAAPR